MCWCRFKYTALLDSTLMQLTVNDIRWNPPQSAAIRRNPPQSAAIRRNPPQSAAIRRNPPQSAAIRRNPPQSADVWVLYWLTVITIPNSSGLLVIWCIAVHDHRHRLHLSLAVKIKLKKIRYGDCIPRYCTCTHKYRGTVPVRLNTAVHRYTGNTAQP